MIDRPGPLVFANRTLNLRSIDVIGYDLDYTLVHYNTAEWERTAYGHAKRELKARGWPVGELVFDPTRVIQGLTIDLELGNLVKATRFGYVIRASHGTRFLDYNELRRAYAGVVVDLASPRFVFLNTLFSLSEATLFTQLVDLADAGRIPAAVGYEDLHRIATSALDEAHQGGTLKSEILADPDRFVELDPDVVTTLIDQRAAGKRLMLITNSDWAYASQMLRIAIDEFLPDGSTWRDLFDTVVVSANKPTFFDGDRELYQVVDEQEGLLRAHRGALEPGGIYSGGSAQQVEASLGLSGDQILYVGDHLFGDVHVSKSVLRWRTALVVRELEPEIEALRSFSEDQQTLERLMGEKQTLEDRVAHQRLARLRNSDPAEIDEAISGLERQLARLDEVIAPVATASGELSNPHWGLLMRAGADKSLFARQLERYADVYTARVAHLGSVTPYGMLRAARAPLAHDV